MLLRISNLSFPGLGIGEFSVNSVAFSIPWFNGRSLDIAWYAIIITCGIIAAVLYTMYRANPIGITPSDIIDFAIPVVLLGVIGARVYYVLTTPGQYSTFLDYINIRNGGLAIYGGIIGGALGVIIMCIAKKIKFTAMADCCMPGVILAQGIGRWGNFMNGEAFGGITDWFCRMGIQNYNSKNTFGVTEMVYVHPTFLYESLWNFLGFAIAALLHKHKKYDGQIVLFVFCWYGFGRFFIEGLRTDSLYIPGTSLRISQVLGAAIFVVTLAMLIFFAIRKPEKTLYIRRNK